MKSLFISLDVFFIGLVISFIIAVLIKGLMFSIRYIFDKTVKKSAHI